MHRRLSPATAGRVALAITLAGLLPAPSLHAGPLDPPPGPVAPTHKTLTEVEPRIPISSLPFIIFDPGSYYVTGNLTGVVDQPGIVIAADNVTIDLMGHTLTGVLGSHTAISGTQMAENVTIKNGRITNWDSAGISLGRVRLLGVEASGNRGNGIAVGFGSLLVDCTANDNTNNGFFIAGAGCSVETCTAVGNGAAGFLASPRNTFRACTASQNAASGFSTGIDCTLIDCTATANTLDGFEASTNCRVDRCTATRNSRHGVVVASYSTVTRCAATAHTQGFGIVAAGDGILVQDCFTAQNIHGVEVTSLGNRIDSNTSTNNTRGFNVASAGNIITRNVARANGANYFIVANNVVGVTVQAPLSGAIAGSSGGAGVGTTNPWANLSY